MLAALVLAALVPQQTPAVLTREAQAATALYAAVNRERRAAGLPALRLDVDLSDAAVEHVLDMARNDYFEHTSPTGNTLVDRLREHNCDYTYAGENIALAGSAIQADRALFASSPHRANTLSDRYTRIGIAVVLNAQGRLLFVEDFAG